MDGIKHKLSFSGDPVQSLREVIKAEPKGGSWFWKLDDRIGMFIEPDLSRKLKVDIETFEIIYE